MRSLLSLDSSEIDRRLGALHDIAGYTYDRDFPHTLRVTVKPQPPSPLPGAGRRPGSWRRAPG